MKLSRFLIIALLLVSFQLVAENAYEVQNNALVLPGDIKFDTHAYDVKDASDPMLDFVAQYLKDKPYITKLRIEGHVYSEKSPEENIKLSLQRAAMISYYLTTKGIDCSRLIGKNIGY